MSCIDTEIYFALIYARSVCISLTPYKIYVPNIDSSNTVFQLPFIFLIPLGSVIVSAHVDLKLVVYYFWATLGKL